MPNVVTMLQNALQLLNSGRMDMAEQLLRQVRQHSPSNADACNLLGIIYAQSNRLDEALTLLKEAVQRMPGNTQYRYNLGNAQSGVGHYNDAAASFRSVLKLQPEFAEAENNLGMALCALGRPEEARTHFIKAIELRSDYGHAYENLGNVLLQLGQEDEAIDSLLTARKMQPDTAQLLNNLANAYSATGEVERATTLYDQALLIEENGEILKNKGMHALGNRQFADAVISLSKAQEQISDDPTISFALADAYENLDDHVAARNCFEQSSRQGFNRALIELRLGGLCKAEGDFEQAVHHFEAAVKIDPELKDAFAALAQVTKSDQQSTLREKIEEALNNIELSVDSRIRLNFALAKQYDDVGEFDAAFDRYRQGNDLRIQKDYADYDIALFRDQVSALIEFFSADFFQSFAKYGSHSRRPIIIFGMPRSGTTLTEQILASHSKVFGAGELVYFQDLVRSLKDRECKDIWPNCLDGFDQDKFKDMAQDYLDFLDSLDKNKERVSNKMPHNFMSIGVIYLLFPDAQFIHCTRQPADNCLSIYFQDFIGNHPYAYDLKALGEYYVEYRRLVDHWHAVLPAPILEMPYEETVSSIERRAKVLVDFCKLPWEETCLEFHKAKRSVKTASVWQARQKIYTSSVERWRNYEGHLQPLIDALGPLVQA